LVSDPFRGRAVVAGIGESPYYRHGESPDPEFVLLLKAIRAACADAGISPKDIDGFCSYGNDRNGPVRLANALGVRDLRVGLMQWEGGGGGMAASVMNAAMAVATGHANCVVAFRGLAQGQFGRFGIARGGGDVTGAAAYQQPYGVLTPGQMYGLKFVRWMHEHGGVGLEAQKAVSLASYRHAQSNIGATMYGRPLTAAAYDAARMIVEPWRLYDFCQENDGAAAIILTPADRAPDLPSAPVHILAAAQGAYHSAGRLGFNETPYASAGFLTVAKRLWSEARVQPSDVDVVQSYENFTGGVVMSLVEHGLCAPEEADATLTLENLSAPQGSIPLNTSGGNLAEAYIHGFNLAIEGVRQLRGTSPNQVPNCDVALITGGPLTTPVSSLVFGTGAVL
jgi:acetyl-CoA acetyltransferase